MHYYEVAISKSPLFKAFYYAYPTTIPIGSRVLVDFNHRQIIGYVLREVKLAHIVATAAEEPTLKEILEVFDYPPVLTETHVGLAVKAAEYYLSPIGKVMDFFFASSPKISLNVRVIRHCIGHGIGLTYESMPGFEDQEASVPLKELLDRLGAKKGKKIIEEWVQQNKVELVTGTRLKQTKTRTDQWVHLTCSLQQLIEAKPTKKEWQILQFLLLCSEEKASFLRKKFKITDPELVSLQQKRWVELEEIPEVEQEYSETRALISLTERQNQILKSILTQIHAEKPILQHLLYGITGSGKTEIYFSLMHEILKKKKSVLFLIPEISLTPQTIARIRARFSDLEVGVFHSDLKASQRQKEWRKAVEGESKILLGTRSSVWVPIPDLGLVIMDEEHDESYMQDDARPFYDTKQIVRWISELWNIPVLYGSATPRIESYYEADFEKKMSLHILTERPKGAQLPKVKIIDLLHAEKVNTFLSKEFVQRVDRVLNEERQVFVLVNRKGFAPLLMCSKCGYVVKCRECDVSMTYHQTKKILLCHYCGFQQLPFAKCPACASEALSYWGYGTEKVEEALFSLFPEKRIVRVDREAIDNAEKLNQVLTQIKEKKVDIVVGTKMISKGLDFPYVELVGVLDADQLLFFPDFRSSERTFQLLCQMSGRAGRLQSDAQVIIQTRSPDKRPIQLSATHDYLQFYAEELLGRKLANYPPYLHVILLNFTSYDLKYGITVSEQITAAVKENLLPEDICLGPTEALIFRMGGNYRYRSLIKTLNTERVVQEIKKILEKNKAFDKFVNVVVDPLGMIL